MNINKNHNAVEDLVWSSVWDPVDYCVWTSVSDVLWSTVCAFAEYSTRTAIEKFVTDSVRDHFSKRTLI